MHEKLINVFSKQETDFRTEHANRKKKSFECVSLEHPIRNIFYQKKIIKINLNHV